MRTLRGRITLVTVAVAVIAVAITGLVSLQLVRSSATDQARAQLAAQADILAKTPRLASAAELADKAKLALGGTLVALVSADGSVDGDAARFVDTPILAHLAKSDAVSTTRTGGPGLVMIEVRATSEGGGIVLALPMTSIDRSLGALTGRILVALGIGLVIAVVGGTLLARTLAAPLGATASIARRLASGERGIPIPTAASTAEVADVASALAALDLALDASEGRQREFLLSISHDLRTPLTAIRGYGEALADGLVDDTREVGSTLVRETQRLDQFVADLLELARLEADDFSLDLAEVELAPVLHELADAWAGRAATLGVSVTVQSALGTARTDARRLRQVLDGLLENALRAGGSVIVSAESGVIRIQDDGPGFVESDLDRVFDRGAMRARYRDVRPVGTGLGLSIAVRLVTRLGGTLTVANRAEGGAAFTVRLP